MIKAIYIGEGPDLSASELLEELLLVSTKPLYVTKGYVDGLPLYAIVSDEIIHNNRVAYCNGETVIAKVT